MRGFYRKNNRWLTEGMRELSDGYGMYGGYYYPYARQFDPVACDILALDRDDYLMDDYYPYPVTGGYPRRRRNIHIPVGNENNFFIDTAYINVEDVEWNRMDRMYRSFVRGLWDDNIRPKGTIFKRYRGYYG